MRFMLAFGIMGLVLAAVAIRQAGQADGAGWLIVAVEAYCAVCLLTLSVAYGLRSAGVDVEELMRRPGASVVLRIVLLPYRVLGGSALYLSRWSDREGPLNPIGTGLYIGRLPFPSERAGLRAAGVDAVLNLCWEFPGLSGIDRDPRFESFWVPILDGAAPTDRQFDEAARWVAARRAEGRCVLVHCAQGHGRTATIAAAVLVRLGLAEDDEEALAIIRAARPLARPSRGQRSVLRRHLAGTADRGRGDDLLRSETH